jgi:fatty acid desaturase
LLNQALRAARSFNRKVARTAPASDAVELVVAFWFLAGPIAFALATYRFLLGPALGASWQVVGLACAIATCSVPAVDAYCLC